MPLPEAGSDDELEVSDEDLEFVQRHSRQLGFLKNLDKSALDKYVNQAISDLTTRFLKPCLTWSFMLHGVCACGIACR